MNLWQKASQQLLGKRQDWKRTLRTVFEMRKIFLIWYSEGFTSVKNM